MTAHYTDWLAGGEVGSGEIDKDQGCIVRRGLAKIAAYRDSEACFTSGERSVHISDVSSHGTRPSKVGTVRVMALVLTSWAM
jgi:hypothetical protein